MDGYDPVLLPPPLILGTLSAIGITGNIIMIIATYKAKLVQCSIPQSFGGAFAIFNQSGAGINIAIVTVYVTSFVILKRNNASPKMRIVFKSIFVTVAIVMGGWFATFIVNNLCPYITTDPYWSSVINIYAGVMVNACVAMNVFVYYTINTEYREVIRGMFGVRTSVAKLHEISTMHGSEGKKTIVTTVVL
ncbi:unnamed protein product [Cylicocyclus nassatus]|uniref:G-protein coupled receptors family 1 profile domain-containing protein n=1 Tax=Cylicocyclus nassatus TaxID=53992 RepID=A0AA36DMZ8_CYLNA|nr:unnamed protein product [Cylicocyclus nassatus]